MKLPKNYFENLSSIKYREYLKLLPNMKKENTKAITMLIFTFIALAILGIFAINPTLSTIAELQRQLDDSRSVYQQMETKIANLGNLKQQYDQLSTDLPFVMNAIPQDPTVPPLVSQIETLARTSNVKVTTLRVNKVLLSKNSKATDTTSSFTFAVEVEGAYEDMVKFAKELAFFNRIVNLDSVSIIKDVKHSSLILAIKGREYYKP